MSQFIFPSAATTTMLLSAVSAANTAAATGSGVDLLTYDGVLMFIQDHGISTGTLDGKIQDSADNSSFADVTGATFTQETTTVGTQKLVMERKAFRRYVKYVGTVATGPAVVSVTMTGVKKYVG